MLLYRKRDHTAPDLDCFGFIEFKFNLSLVSLDQSAELRQVVFEVEFVRVLVIIFKDRVAPRHWYVGDP